MQTVMLLETPNLPSIDPRWLAIFAAFAAWIVR